MTVSALLAVTPEAYGAAAAVLISASGFAYAIYNGVRTDRRGASGNSEQAMNARINDLARQVDELKEELRECSRQRAALERENVALMRQLIEQRPLLP